jgi:hypothetical protein
MSKRARTRVAASPRPLRILPIMEHGVKRYNEAGNAEPSQDRAMNREDKHEARGCSFAS